MTTKVLLRTAVLLLLFATLATPAVPQDDDLGFDADVETPLIEGHRHPSIFHRIKRGFWDLFGEGDAETTTTETPETPVEPYESQTEQDKEPLPLTAEDDTGGQQTDYDENAAAGQQTDYDEDARVVTTSSRERNIRESGEDPNVYTNDINHGEGDDEDDDDYGSGDIEGSADGGFEPNSSFNSVSEIEVDEPVPIAKKPGSELGPETQPHSYRVTTIISEPYRKSLLDRDSDEFKELSAQLSQAIDGLYQNALPDQRTRSKILKFVQTSDPVATQVSLDIESTSPDVEKIRSIFAEQLQLHTLGNIQARPDGFSLKNTEDLKLWRCDPETEYTCQNDGECIPISAKCDGIVQCIDGADEADCAPPETATIPEAREVSSASAIEDLDYNDNFGTTESEHTDLSTTSLPPLSKEAEILCRGDQTIRCRDGSRCFGSIQRCDGELDCDDGSDEENCSPPGCEPGEFACDVSRCISNEQKCDFVAQCDDQSDELDCPKPPDCGPNQFKCKNGQCIQEALVCDQTPHCYDQSDEINCQPLTDIDDQGYVWPVADLNNNLGIGINEGSASITTGEVDPMPRWPFNYGYCPIGRWPCRTGKQCIPVWQRCDREPHCDDMSDEDRCDETICNPDSEWTCRNGRCIEKSLKCNGLDDCGDRSDEQTCPCTEAQFKCDNGFCIPIQLRCDKFNHCQDKSDERDCAGPTSSARCGSQEFECDNGECIINSQVCNSVADCADESDELNCPEKVCTGDQFRCNDGTCLSGSSRCNLVRECPSGEDEDQCGCGISEFRCMDGSCIPDNLVCDRSDDCPDGSDEGCDPCKLKSPTLTNLIRCRLRLSTPLCQTVISAIPPLRSFGDLNSNCKKVIHKHVLRNDSAWADGNEFSNTETSSISSTEGRDVNSYENNVDPNTEVEIIQSLSVSRDTDRSPEVKSIYSNETSVETEIHPGVRPGLRGSPDSSWEYVRKVSKDRFKKRPKQRPMEKKLYDQGVKRCQINCLKAWARKKHRAEFDNSLEMKVEMNRNWKTIYCLERAGNRSSEENCFDVDMVLRSRQLAPLRRSNREDHSKPGKITRRNGEPRRQTRGTRIHDYFQKYGILKKFTPESIKATTAATSDVSFVTEKNIADSGSIGSHEAIRERARLEVMYYDKCGFDCEEYFMRLYDGKSSEISRERKSERGKKTTTEKPTEGTTTEEVTEQNGPQTVTDSNSLWDSWFPPIRGGGDSSKSAEDKSIKTSSSHPKKPTVESKVSWTSPNGGSSGSSEYTNFRPPNEIEYSVELPKESNTRRKHKSRKDRKRDRKIRKNGRKQTTSTETTIQYSTTEKLDKERCPDDHFLCDEENCIKKDRVCDGFFDCEDQADEDDCGHTTDLSNNLDHDMENEISDWSKIDDEVVRTTYSNELQLTTEVIATSEPNGHQTVTEKGGLWGTFDLGSFLGGDDGSKSAERRSTEASSGRPEITTQKSWGGFDWLSWDKSNSIESADFRERMSIENSVEMTRESSTDRKNKNKSHRKGDKKERKGGHKKTTKTSSTEETEEESCPDDQHYCDKGRCVKYERTCDGAYDCEDQSDERECDYYNEELKDFEYDEDSDGSHLKNDDTDLGTTRNNDLKSTADVSTTTETYEHQTVTEKERTFDLGFGSWWGTADDSKSAEVNSIEASSSRPEITTQKWSWESRSPYSRTDDPKSSENESSSSPSSKQTITTEKYDWGLPSWSFWEDDTEESKSGEQKKSEEQVEDDDEDSELIDIPEDISTTTDESTTRDETRLTRPTYDVTTSYPKSREDDERNTWTNSVTKHDSVTERVTSTSEPLKQNYNAYKNPFAWPENPREWHGRGRDWRERRRQYYQRLRQQQMRNQHEEEEQRRMKEEQEQDRRRDEYDRQIWELNRKNQEIKEEERRLRIQKLKEIAVRRRPKIAASANDWRRWPSKTDCFGSSHRCRGLGRITQGVADCPSMDFTCGDGSCVPQNSVCNGIDDCPLAEDELHCEKECTVSEFRCVRDGKCINEAYRCDRTFDCSDHSDEDGCPPGSGNQTGTGPGNGKPGPVDPDHTTEGNSVGGEGTETTNIGVRECDPSSEFRCRNGQCIQLRRKCDVVPDCYDSSDETDCGHCNPDQWKCNSEECIPEIGRCDGNVDCADASDEIDCVADCPSGLFRCDDGLCLDGSKHCDGIPDCRDRSDEKNCSCPVGKWPCSNGICIDQDFRCDKHLDCLDGSDEANCPSVEPTTPPAACQRDEFQCSDGECIPGLARCDRISDCRDAGDELGCPQGVEALDKTSSAERRPERTTYATVPVPRSCAAGDFVCADGTCIPAAHHCDHFYDCRDFTDEQYCFGCTQGEFECRNRNCVRQEQQCNQYDDCGDNSDEENCVPTRPVGSDDPFKPCSANEWRCENGPCIPMNQRCDNVVDCPRDNSDELDCNYQVLPCSPWEWRCENGPCIPLGERCNGRQDCPRDNSDELDCPETEIPRPSPHELDLKTYPNDQIIKEKAASEDREVVIQCRDEGPLRARVHWIREDGAPLPPGSTDVNGRLEMPNVQVHHSGNYVCEALGVPANTPGRRVISHLTVEKEETPTSGPPRACQFDEATCSNGDCIPKSRVCDGRYDCTDGTDEHRCGQYGCEPNQFRCANKECVSKVWRCDGDRDCVDGSDEQNCEPAPPGSACQYNEYQCADRQCIPKSFHCDKQTDCLDGSDEIGCTKVQILRPPQHMVILNVGETFTITCTALGIPYPEISWRLNWGHIPAKCTTTSINGTGVLTCPSIAIEDQGAYSCEAINTLGWEIAVPDAILKVESSSPDVCPQGTFNSLARTADECISCFCFGVATQCHSADLFTYQLPAPFDQFNVVSVETYPDIRILGEVTGNAPEVRPVGRNGVQVSDRYGDSGNPSSILYFALPESYHSSQLKSYGGYLKYTVRYGGRGRPNDAPSVILTGNNYVLVHKGEAIPSDYETERSVRFFFGDWVKKQGWDEVTASREEIMMALAHVDNILIKVKYDDGPIDTTITNVFMDTADVRNTNQGAATFVEECRCPVGYSGLSCEHCESGYIRRDSGPWLGQCYREEPVCQPGYYKDPSRNIPCQPCPCPLTDPSNQYSRTCHLGSDGQPTCDCPQGYLGRRCEQCAPGYQGNPLRPGDSCVKVDECDPNGSLSPYADPATGVCRCKALSTGRTCNKCKANTFHLAATNKFGCVSCFCMGVTSKCTSSNWYRREINVAFTSSIRDFSLIESKSTNSPPIVDDIHLNTVDREIVYNSFPNRETNDVYYWQLPSNFLGDQLASYGGNLKYTVRYVPTPGGARSRNNAADVELISSNDIILRHYSGKQLEPNTAETFTVPLLEDYWQRNDGTTADREHLLMALADVQAIRIKATYTTHTDEAALSSISLDTAVNSNTGKARAVEVEQCSCPVGYRGLSCEDCDVGYTRGDDGLYLGSCIPCNCNGHSTQCDPETGVCENCRDYTTGENCEQCIYGYEGDATRGSQQDCQPGGGPTRPPSCTCDPAGSLGTSCYGGQCECKTNVEGPECNRCRPSTFGLSANNIDGCAECYCSGVTNQCHESSLFINQIPTVIYDSSHGFTLTDSNRRDVITEGFDLNTATNEIGYRYPDSRSQRLFWSLPSVITGNQVKSYGGNLWITQHITTRTGAVSEKDQDVVLIGNGITLFWTNSEDIQPGIPLSYSVPLVESAWTRLTQEEGLRSASRTDLMTVLSNLEAILVRATHSSEMTATYISDVSLDTAVEQVVNNRRATQVEACRCPPGYTGTSCETCAAGYYRDVTDTSRSYLGACNICPCSGNEQECKVDRLGGVKCYCLQGFSGLDCSVPESSTTEITVTDLPPPRIIVTIRETPIQIVEIGSSVTYHCAGRSEDSKTISIEWQKESGQLPPGRSYDDTQGILIIRDLKVTDSGIYVCQVSDGINIAIQKVTLTVGGERPVKPRPVIEPRYLSVQEGNPVEFKCEASGNPPPQLSWIRVRGEINPDAVFENGVWSLASVRKSDEAEYKCIAQNSAGTTEQRTILYVTARTQPQPEPPAPIISPNEWNDGPGVPVNLACTAPQGARITWTRSDNAPLPVSAIEQNGVLTIYDPSPSDSGYYICTAITYEGIETRSTARVTIQSSPRGPPSVRVEPERQEVSQGTLVEVKCIVTGDPTPVVTWTKLGEPLAAHVQVLGNNLRIINPQVSDRGVYVCRASNSGGNAQGSAVIDVNRREMPIIELYPQQDQVVRIGGSALLQCRATAGLPTPTVSWAREDGRPFSSNVEQLPGGILRFNHVTLEDGGSFVCSASNEVGSVSLIAIIEISTPPVITITPSNRSPLTVKLGERVKLVCAASGQPQPYVSWSKHKAGAAVYASQPESRSFTAVYEISSVSYDDEGSYTCLATNNYGPVEERIQIRVENSWAEPETSTLSPNTNGSNVGVTIPEESLRIPDGGKVEMRCQVYGSDQEAIYLDWKRNDGRTLPQRSTVRGGILLIPAVTKDDAGAYICQGLNSNGNVLFTATSYLEIISPPRIELEPIQQVVRPGESPSVICRVTGDQPIDIEWHAIDRPLPYTVSQRGGFLQFNGITSADAGKYVCKATNNAGTAEAVAEVLINEYHQPPLPANQHDVHTFVGNSVRLDCPADSRSTIIWSRERGEIPRNSRRLGNFLELTEVKPEDRGRYICRITTENGASSSNYVDLTVESQSAPAVTVRVRASQDLVNIGDSIDVQCDASGARDARYRWTRVNELSLPRNAQDFGTVLRLTNVAMIDNGIYRCTAETPEGSFEKDYELIVQGGHNDAPAVETKLAPYGSGVVMDCRADIEPPIRYQWQKLGGRLPVNSRTSENRIELLDVKAEDAGTYICEASNGRVNIEVPQVLVVTGVVPNFNQAPESYISFAPIPDATLQFQIEVSFKPENYDGIILYNGQYSDGTGDFILLSLVGGYPEFRFDLGSSPAVIQGRKPITLGKWHTIKLQRDHKHGTMLVDGEGPYRGVAGGRFQTLDLSEPLFIGGVPDYNATSRQVNVKSGFVGCISKLVIGDNQLDLTGDLLSSVGVTTCETCAENPCSNSGVCQEAATENGYTCLCPAGYSGKNCTNIGQACYPDVCGEGTCIDRDDGFVCSCPIGKTGTRCEFDVNVVEPGFHDRNAYLAYQTPKVYRKIKLAMKFKPSDIGNGILMYCSQSNDGLGDFIALIIKDRHVEFRFDLGSGMAVIRSNHMVQPGVWLNLQASRDAREGKLSINDEPPVIGRSPGPIKSMTLNTLLYIGGVNRHKLTINKNVGVERNFRGCISELDIAGQPIDILKSVVDSSNIKDCVMKYSNQTEFLIYDSTPSPTRPPTSPATTQFNPCAFNPCVHGSCQLTHTRDYSCMCEYGYVGRNCENILKQCELLSPCRNGGMCTDLHGGYKCDCQLGFNGHRCESPVEISNDVAFRGDGWLELERTVMTHEEEKEVLGFEISTNKSTGVIMWHGQTPTDLSPDDYISLAVVDGYVEYQYNLGSGPAVIRVTAQRVDDGERHRIVLKRQGSEGSIELNGEHTESGASDGLQQLLNARGSVYLGGVPDYAMTYGRYQDGFSGCIYTLEVQDSGAIVIGDKAIRGRNVYPCTSEIDRPPIRGDGGHVQR